MSRTGGLAVTPTLFDRASDRGRSRADPVGDSERNASLDVLRLAAAFVIVLFHAKSPGGQLMPAAMAIFAALLGYFALAGRSDQSLATLAANARTGCCAPS